jgi:trk system potassium uptake protein TrkA
MYIVIAGCGRLGALLAGQLSRLGHSVVIIDHTENAFDKLPGEFSGFKITGDASEHSVLEMAEIKKADCLFSVCREDTLNLMIAQLARHVFEVPRAFARVYQGSYEDILSPLGIEIICPTQLALCACLASLPSPKDAPEHSE